MTRRPVVKDVSNFRLARDPGDCTAVAFANLPFAVAEHIATYFAYILPLPPLFPARAALQDILTRRAQLAPGTFFRSSGPTSTHRVQRRVERRAFAACNPIQARGTGQHLMGEAKRNSADFVQLTELIVGQCQLRGSEIVIELRAPCEVR